jgi:Ca-activated chloride channel family protein
VLLITDGRSNAGEVTPEVAAQAARALGIRVHTIGIGASGPAELPVENPLGGITYQKVRAELDESTLAEIARITGGNFYLAANGGDLQSILNEIDQMEKHTIEEKVSYHVRETFTPLLFCACILLILELTLRFSFLGRVP